MRRSQHQRRVSLPLLLGLLAAILLLTACSEQSATAAATPAPTHHGHHDATPSPPGQPLATPALTITPGATTVVRYGLFAQNFTLGGSYANPWEQVQVTLTLTAPSGQQATVGGFYLAPGTWQARFSPDEVGSWSWQGSLSDGRQTKQYQGTFTVLPSAWPGFVRRDPQNPLRWVFANGAPYYPLGIGDCLLDVDHSGSPLDNLGFDGGFRQPGDPDYGRITDLDTYLRAYSAAGVNLFRWSVDNCSFNLYQSIAPTPAGNTYLAQEGLWGDQLVLKLRQYGLRTYLTLFGSQPPYPTATADQSKMAAVERYVQYVVNRYGALVDFWELMNEFPNPPATINDDWYMQIAAYLRRVDPYHHAISTSWQRPDLAAIDITAPHWYQRESEFVSDAVTVEQIAHWRRFGKPIIFGEQGNAEQNWDERSALRMRLRAWTAFFNEGVLIFWNSSFAKDYRGGGASNLYLGPEERGFLRVLQAFSGALPAGSHMAPLAVSDPTRVRGYALRAANARAGTGTASYAAYLHAYTNHSAPTAGLFATVDLPGSGIATWVDPATGAVLATQPVSAGELRLPVPPFTTDVALQVVG